MMIRFIVVLISIATLWPTAVTMGDQPVDDKQTPIRVRSNGFPKTAFEYAKLVEPDLGVPPTVNLDEAVEIPLYVKGVQRYGNLGRTCDNPSFLGKDTVSGSTLQRYEGRTADGEPLPNVIWISFARNSSSRFDAVVGSVQMIGYNQESGATAFFESCDRIEPWVKLDKETLRMRGTLPGIEDQNGFNEAFRTPGAVQCVQCHQADPFITNDFINAAKIPGTDETVVPKLDADSPYYVIGGENWDMRTVFVDGNRCFECHRVGMTTMTMFMQNGWNPNQHMPPDDPGRLKEDLSQLLQVWRKGPDNFKGADWIIPPARGEQRKLVEADYPNKASFNNPGRSFDGNAKQNKGRFEDRVDDRQLSDVQRQEIRQLLKDVDDVDTRKEFEDWFEKMGMDESALRKLRAISNGKDAK
ncbi:hypothetical protein [Planctomycetes bacterium SV_7m_r]